MSEPIIISEKDYIIENLSTIVSLIPLVVQNRFTNITRDDLGIVKDAWIHVNNGFIKTIQSGPVPTDLQKLKRYDAAGGMALPGLVDAHTHPAFAGSRSNEFCMRLDGKTYQDIAAAGGGIASTVKSTRACSDVDLRQLIETRLHTFLKNGVTSVEVKSGYGLSVAEELRHLRILKTLQKDLNTTIVITCLALHAVPKEFLSARQWADACAAELLPQVAKENLAEFVDAFVEAGYFSVDDIQGYLEAAKRLGLGIRIHADEFSDAKAALCAARFSASSADHLQFANSEGIDAMAKAGTVAMILPGTSLYTNIPFTDAKKFTSRGCPVGLSTDFNPGSSPIENLRQVMTIGALHCKLSMAEAIAAVTWVPAKSLNLSYTTGALSAGMLANILVMPMTSPEEFVADLGQTTLRFVAVQKRVTT
ncbi:MAG: imidazolonepropionase [Proteobacteria bacterium]|nr:imidazolonepropionase [Pseudomonadota bacterium]